MKKLSFVTIIFVLLIFINLDKSYAQKLTGQDDRIILFVDSLERADIFPEMLIEKDPTGRLEFKADLPPSGFDYVIIHVRWVVKKDLYSRKNIAVAQLTDEKGNSYHTIYGEFKAPLDKEKETSGYYALLMPKDQKPVQMKFSYTFMEVPSEPKDELIGEIYIKL